MRKKLLIGAGLAAVGCICLLGGATMERTRWLNDEQTKRARWHWEEWCRQHGRMSNMVIYPFRFDTNIAVAIGYGTNEQQIEFGFRDDGVVVWRKR